MNNISLAIDLKLEVNKIEELEKELTKHTRVQQGFETLFQTTINTILICYAHSSTKTRQGLAAIFTQDDFAFMGATISMTMYFTPILGLFNLLHHYQSMYSVYLNRKKLQ